MVIESIGILANIWINNLIPISHTGQNFSLKLLIAIIKCDYCPNNDSTTFAPVCINSVGLMVIDVFLPPYQSTSSKIFHDESELVW